ncbi:hypothetical protein V499_01118 [Pseudogymnoascus sp. VKM F-103]|nr:hypothetical protein V499_01118 [Pseudogymnoascus sp. VKM F-103]
MIPQQNPSTRHTVAMYPKLPICQPIAVPGAVDVDVLADPVPVVDPIAVGLVADTTDDVATALGQGLAAQLPRTENATVYTLNSDPETEQHVKGLNISKQLTAEDGRSGVNPSHNSKHDHDCDGWGPFPPNCTELALSLSAQPPGRARPGVALEPPIVAQLSCTFADLPQVWAVATLLSHTGEALLDKLEGKIAEFADPDTVEFRFTQLVINDPGKYRIRITLMQMDFSDGSHPDGAANVCEFIETDGILVDAAAPGGMRAREFDVDERCGFRPRYVSYLCS